MTPSSFLRRPLCLAATVAALGASPAQATNLFVNSSFETPSVTYQALGAGSTAITGWTTVLSGVEHFSPSAFGVGAAADGLMVVDLANYTYLNGGGLEQSVATVPGQSYDLSFAAGNSLSSGRTGTGIIKVTLNGATTLSFNTAVASSAAMAWEQRSFSFVASGTSTLLRFWNDQNPNLYFANIDAASLQPSAVPEPEQWFLMGAGLAAMGATLRRRLR
jgi:Protein of unknown function (DUF642)/PEP-CTERM motif